MDHVHFQYPEVDGDEPMPSRSVRIFDNDNTQPRSALRGSSMQISGIRNWGIFLFRRRRQIFITRLYLLAIVFIILTILQWIPIVLNQTLVEFFKDRYYISLIAGLIALLLVTFVGLYFQMRYIAPFNWIFACLIVELETLALLGAPLDLSSDLGVLGICLIATIAINAVFTFIGIKFPIDLTQGIVIAIVISVIFYVTASIFLILLIATEMYFLNFFLIIGELFLLLMYIMYVSQLITGKRSGSVRWNDFILAALMVYFNFMLTFGSILHLSKEFLY